MIKLFINIMEILAEVILYETFMKRKSNKSLMLFLIVECMVTYSRGIWITPYINNKIIRAVILMVLCIIVSYVAYQAKFCFRIFSVVIYENFIYAFDLVIMVFVLLLSGMSMNELLQSKYYFLAALAAKSILVLLSFALFIFWKKMNLCDYFSSWSCFIALLPMMIIMFIFFAKYQDLSVDDTDFYSAITVIGLSAIVLYQMILLLREKQNALAQQERQILRNMNNVTVQNMKQLMKSYENQRRLTHDFNNEISSIKGLLEFGNNKKVIDYINSLQSRSNATVLNFKTHNPMVDVMINTKYAEAEANDITMDVQIDDLSQLPLLDEDIVTILGNALNNAMEACLKLPPENRQITVKIISNTSTTLIFIQNPVASPIKIQNNRVVTTRQDILSHGYGLRNIEFALSKYEHDYSILYKDGSFQLSIEIFH